MSFRANNLIFPFLFFSAHKLQYNTSTKLSDNL
jgi:hypothetical protein